MWAWVGSWAQKLACLAFGVITLIIPEQSSITSPSSSRSTSHLSWDPLFFNHQPVQRVPGAVLTNYVGAAMRNRRNAQGWPADSVADADFTMQGLVEPWGYPLEHYTVPTTDGFILGLYRIPTGRNAGHNAAPQTRATYRPPVLLQHGLLQSSAVWVDNLPEQSLAFCLADAGFDVWMGNSRGNTYSRQHVALTPDQTQFWDFSWDEMARYDLPALVDYVLATTGQPQLAYVGHSQGTTTALAAIAENHAGLAAKISAAALLAPVAFLQHLDSPPIKELATLGTDAVFTKLGLGELLPRDPNFGALVDLLCTAESSYCIQIIDDICGLNDTNVNATQLPTILQYTPAGSSVRNLAHWAQGVRLPAPTFQMFDWGKDCSDVFFRPQPCNSQVYGSDDVPLYNLSRITVPLALFSGGRDKMAAPADVAALMQVLSPATVVLHHHEHFYGHVDFTWGIDAHKRVYPAIIKFIRGTADHREHSIVTDASDGALSFVY